jgi:hypothetical protein
MNDADYATIGKAFCLLTNADIYRVSNLLRHATLVHNKKAAELYMETWKNFYEATSVLNLIRSNQKAEVVG